MTYLLATLPVLAVAAFGSAAAARFVAYREPCPTGRQVALVCMAFGFAAGDLQHAMASFTSDMDKHAETADAMEALGGVAIMVLVTGDQAEARRFIEGFN